MQIVRLMFVVALLPLGLAACQNTQTEASNAYGGNVFYQPLNLPSSVKNISPARLPNLWIGMQD